MLGIISPGSNITHRKANKTAECPYEHSANENGVILYPKTTEIATAPTLRIIIPASTMHIIRFILSENIIQYLKAP